jgi:hypothetical protein
MSQRERRANSIEMLERVVRMEEGQKHLISMMEKHLAAPCVERGCQLHDDVIKMRSAYKWCRGMAMAACAGMVGLLSKAVWAYYTKQ